jgi:hypothetical protein
LKAVWIRHYLVSVGVGIEIVFLPALPVIDLFLVNLDNLPGYLPEVVDIVIKKASL